MPFKSSEQDFEKHMRGPPQYTDTDLNARIPAQYDRRSKLFSRNVAGELPPHREGVRHILPPETPDGSWSRLPPDHVETKAESWSRPVLEVGLSESKKLKQDARFWLDNSDGTVKLMLTVDISEDSATLEAWERKDGDVLVVKKIEAEMRDSTWRIASEINALQFPVEDIFGLPPRQGHSEVILLRGD
ncbi:hypothetical protein KEM56_001346 [Ascosphaera pollenicola]|nr:hypothetical protein KEM56_001346 [Ascosphaera pollenicola]